MYLAKAIQIKPCFKNKVILGKYNLCHGIAHMEVICCLMSVGISSGNCSLSCGYIIRSKRQLKHAPWFFFFFLISWSNVLIFLSMYTHKKNSGHPQNMIISQLRFLDNTLHTEFMKV